MKVTGGFGKVQVRGHGRSLGTPQGTEWLRKLASGEPWQLEIDQQVYRAIIAAISSM
jgi:hypothetical protein